jgi:hypothetical protein
MERMIADALDEAGVRYRTERDDPMELDFALPNGVYIEVKQFYSNRSNEQLKRAPNVILAQGEGAVRFLANLLRKFGSPADDQPL